MTSRKYRTGLGKDVQVLTNKCGVYRPDLHRLLGGDLRKLWCITSIDAGSVRLEVIRHLEHLVDMYAEGDDNVIARVFFNITDNLAMQKESLED